MRAWDDRWSMPVPSRLRSLPVLAVVLASSAFACVGNDASNPQPGTGTGGGTGADGQVVPGTDSGGPSTHAIGGTVHFLQSGGALKLSNGADTVGVTDSGAFTFPKRVADGAPYDVTIVSRERTRST
jgi:hypothetical protein